MSEGAGGPPDCPPGGAVALVQAVGGVPLAVTLLSRAHVDYVHNGRHSVNGRSVTCDSTGREVEAKAEASACGQQRYTSTYQMMHCDTRPLAGFPLQRDRPDRTVGNFQVGSLAQWAPHGPRRTPGHPTHNPQDETTSEPFAASLRRYPASASSSADVLQRLLSTTQPKLSGKVPGSGRVSPVARGAAPIEPPTRDDGEPPPRKRMRGAKRIRDSRQVSGGSVQQDVEGPRRSDIQRTLRHALRQMPPEMIVTALPVCPSLRQRYLQHQMSFHQKGRAQSPLPAASESDLQGMPEPPEPSPEPPRIPEQSPPPYVQPSVIDASSSPVPASARESLVQTESIPPPPPLAESNEPSLPAPTISPPPLSPLAAEDCTDRVLPTCPSLRQRYLRHLMSCQQQRPLSVCPTLRQRYLQHQMSSHKQNRSSSPGPASAQGSQTRASSPVPLLMPGGKLGSDVTSALLEECACAAKPPCGPPSPSAMYDYLGGSPRPYHGPPDQPPDGLQKQTCDPSPSLASGTLPCQGIGRIPSLIPGHLQYRSPGGSGPLLQGPDGVPYQGSSKTFFEAPGALPYQFPDGLPSQIPGSVPYQAPKKPSYPGRLPSPVRESFPNQVPECSPYRAAGLSPSQDLGTTSSVVPRHAPKAPRQGRGRSSGQGRGRTPSQSRGRSSHASSRSSAQARGCAINGASDQASMVSPRGASDESPSRAPYQASGGFPLSAPAGTQYVGGGGLPYQVPGGPTYHNAGGQVFEAPGNPYYQYPAGAPYQVPGGSPPPLSGRTPYQVPGGMPYEILGSSPYPAPGKSPYPGPSHTQGPGSDISEGVGPAVSRKMEEQAQQWLAAVPVFPREKQDDKLHREQMTRRLVDSLAAMARSRDFASKARDLIEKNLENMPMWEPGTSPERKIFKKHLADDLLGRMEEAQAAAGAAAETDAIESLLWRWLVPITRGLDDKKRNNEKFVRDFSRELKTSMAERVPDDDIVQNIVEFLDALEGKGITVHAGDKTRLANNLLNEINPKPKIRKRWDQPDSEMRNVSDELSELIKDIPNVDTRDRDTIKHKIIEALAPFERNLLGNREVFDKISAILKKNASMSDPDASEFAKAIVDRLSGVSVSATNGQNGEKRTLHQIQEEILDFVEDVCDERSSEARQKRKGSAEKLATKVASSIGQPRDKDDEDRMLREATDYLKKLSLVVDEPREELALQLVERLRKPGERASTPRRGAPFNKTLPRVSAIYDEESDSPDTSNDRSQGPQKKVTDYTRELSDAIKAWAAEIGEVLDDDTVRNLAVDIAERQKYLQLNPDAEVSAQEELAYLKFQVYRWLNKVIDDSRLPTTVDKTEALMSKFGQIEIPQSVRPSDDHGRRLKVALLAWLKENRLYQSECCRQKLARDMFVQLLVDALAPVLREDAASDDVLQIIEGCLRQLAIEPKLKADDKFMGETAAAILEHLQRCRLKGAPPTSDDCCGWIAYADARRIIKEADCNEPAIKSPATILLEVVERWCESLPLEDDTPEKRERADRAKRHAANRLLNKLGHLNMSPNTADDDFLYDAMLQDEIDDILSGLQDPIVQRNLTTLKEDLIERMRPLRQTMRAERLAQACRQNLRDEISRTLPFETFTEDERAHFELLKDGVVDAFINLHFVGDDEELENKYRTKINEEIDKFCDDYLRRHPDAPADSGQLSREMYEALRKVRIPSDASFLREVELIRTKDDIAEWLKGIPLAPRTTKRSLRTNGMVSMLAKKLCDIEREKRPGINYGDKVKKELVKWLKKIPLRSKNDDDLNRYAEEFTNRLNETVDSRRVSASSRRPVDPEPEGAAGACGHLPPSSLSKSEREHLECVRRRALVCGKLVSFRDVSVGSVPVDAGSQTGLRSRSACGPLCAPPSVRCSSTSVASDASAGAGERHSYSTDAASTCRRPSPRRHLCVASDEPKWRAARARPPGRSCPATGLCLRPAPCPSLSCRPSLRREDSPGGAAGTQMKSHRAARNPPWLCRSPGPIEARFGCRCKEMASSNISRIQNEHPEPHPARRWPRNTTFPDSCPSHTFYR